MAGNLEWCPFCDKKGAVCYEDLGSGKVSCSCIYCGKTWDYTIEIEEPNPEPEPEAMTYREFLVAMADDHEYWAWIDHINTPKPEFY